MFFFCYVSHTVLCQHYIVYMGVWLFVYVRWFYKNYEFERICVFFFISNSCLDWVSSMLFEIVCCFICFVQNTLCATVGVRSHHMMFIWLCMKHIILMLQYNRHGKMHRTVDKWPLHSMSTHNSVVCFQRSMHSFVMMARPECHCRLYLQRNEKKQKTKKLKQTISLTRYDRSR